MNKILSPRDLAFLLYEWLDVETLTARERFKEHSRETFDGFLALSERLAAREFAPHNALNDQHEPFLDGERVRIIPEVKRALDAFNAAGLTSAATDEPDAGSSLSDISTRAVPQRDESHRLFGTKMWISGGEHDLSENIIALDG